MLILENEKQKEIHHVVLFFAAQSQRNCNQMSATIKKKKVACFSNKCVYLLKHRKLGDFVPTQLVFSLLLSPWSVTTCRWDWVSSAKWFPWATWASGIRSPASSPLSATHEEFLYHQQYLRIVFVWRHSLKYSVRFYGLPIVHIYWGRH